MPLTNKYRAPDAFVKAIEGDPYTKGDADFSATELLKPPQIVRLYNEHKDTITTDVRDEWWKLLGKGVHTILEQGPPCEECAGIGFVEIKPHHPDMSRALPVRVAGSHQLRTPRKNVSLLSVKE